MRDRTGWRSRRRAVVVLVSLVLALTGCTRGGGPGLPGLPGDPKIAWRPRPGGGMDAAQFQKQYQPVIFEVRVATDGQGFTWDEEGSPLSTVIKDGTCALTMQQKGTWTGDDSKLRSLRDKVNRVLVSHDFHAGSWDDSSGSEVLASVDRNNVLLEIRLVDEESQAAPLRAEIDVYLAADGVSC